jgi:hypothetical protein
MTPFHPHSIQGEIDTKSWIALVVVVVALVCQDYLHHEDSQASIRVYDSLVSRLDGSRVDRGALKGRQAIVELQSIELCE